MSVLPTDAAERKAVPLAEGLLYYFPNALVEVARVSKRGNDQHNPGERMHWAMEKSTDHADCILRHLIDAGTVDSDGQRHTAKVAWRALALLETELLAEGAAAGRNAIHLPPSPDYDPASVAFRHGDTMNFDVTSLAGADSYARRFSLSSSGATGVLDMRTGVATFDKPPTATELADADGCMEYGNPITPAGAQPDMPPWSLP